MRGEGLMPQLDFSVFPSQLFWLCVTFFTMLFVMSKFITPRIAEMINLRKEKIDDYLEKAAEIKVQAEAALDKYQQALKFATEEANQSIAKTQQDLKNMIERKQSDLDNELAAQIAEGEKKIAASKQRAMMQVQQMAETLALDVVKKLGFNDLKAEDVRNAVNHSVKE